MVKLQDIAEKFDISVSTVSRILNGKGRVTKELREDVLAYAKEVRYTPNLIAKSLKLQESRSIGLVVPDITNVYYGIIFNAIESFARDKGYSTILFNCVSEDSRKKEYVDQIQNSYVDGMIVATTGSEIWPTVDSRMLDKVVFIDNVPETNNRKVDYIGVDNEYSAYKLTKLMLEKGYSKIMTVTGPSRESTAKERLAGFVRAMNEHELGVDEDSIVRTSFMYEDAWQKISQEFDKGNIPEAILTHNNVTAYAALRAANNLGIEVPSDMGITCFDHIDIYGFMEPKFTNMIQPAHEMGRLAAERLIRKLTQNSKHHEPETTILKSVFIQGETL